MTLALKPDSISFDEAATSPVGATTVWQGLFAVRFARWKGAHVLSTTSASNFEFVRALGAEHVVDYAQADALAAARAVDLVFDTVGGATQASASSVVKRGGALVTVAGMPDEASAQERGVHAARFSAQVSSEVLATFARLISAGEIKAIVGATFPLNDAGNAQELSQLGHGRGRNILQIA
jgi:NADPH:quinone reductase-like Zn-dependent oxidoreductase